MFKYQKTVHYLIVRDNLDRISKLPDEILGTILSRLKLKEVVATSILSKRWEHVWATMPNLEEFTLRSTGHVSGIKRLRTIFTCRTLVFLKIEGTFALHLPGDFCLPNLEALHLDSVIHEDDASAERLFSGCPCLEELDIKRHSRDGVHVLSISGLLLTSLSITFPKFDTDSGAGYVTKINAPDLETLTLNDEMSEEYLLTPSPSLDDACVFRKCVYGVLEGIKYVRGLTLSGNIMESLNTVVRDHDLPKFQHLSQLELGVGEYIDWSFLPKLLESTSNLENLFFPEGLVVPDYTGKNFRRFYWVSPEKTLECLLSKLKTVEIENFVGVGGEVYLILFFLESSDVLERMEISCYDLGGKWKMIGNRQQAMKEIRCCFLGSERCEVEFFE